MSKVGRKEILTQRHAIRFFREELDYDCLFLERHHDDQFGQWMDKLMLQ